MKYFRVKHESTRIVGRVVIGTLAEGELLTEMECRKRWGILFPNEMDDLLEEVSISQKKTYFCFGCRFKL